MKPNKDLGEEIISKLIELNKKLDKLFGGKDGHECSTPSDS